jgi:hypothetical protein
VPLLASAVFFDKDTSTWGAIVFVLVWIGIAYLVLVPAAIVVRRRGRGGRVLFTIGMAAVALAESLTIGGGFAAAPGLAMVPLASSFRPTGELARLRAATSIVVLVLTLTWYVAVLLSFL